MAQAISLEQAYAVACKELGEARVMVALLQQALAEAQRPPKGESESVAIQPA